MIFDDELARRVWQRCLDIVCLKHNLRTIYQGVSVCLKGFVYDDDCIEIQFDHKREHLYVIDKQSCKVALHFEKSNLLGYDGDRFNTIKEHMADLCGFSCSLECSS